MMKVEKIRSGVVFALSSFFANNNPFSILFSPSIFFNQTLIKNKKQRDKYLREVECFFFLFPMIYRLAS